LNDQSIIPNRPVLSELFWFVVLLVWFPVIFGENFFFNQAMPGEDIAISQRSYGLPFLGIISIAALLQLGLLLRFFRVWMLPSVLFSLSLLALEVIPADIRTWSFIWFVDLDLLTELPDFVRGVVASTNLDTVLFWFVRIFFAMSVFSFLMSGQLMSLAFGALFGVLLIDTFVFKFREFKHVIWERFGVEGLEPLTPASLMDWFYAGYNPSVGGLMIVAFLLGMGSVVIKAYRDNVVLMRTLSFKLFWLTSWKVLFRLWWPAVLVFLAASFGWLLLYEQKVEPRMVCALELVEAEDEDATELDCQGDKTLKQALLDYSEGKFRKSQDKSLDAIDDAFDEITDFSEKGPAEIAAILEEETRGRLPGTTHNKCGLLSFDCLVMNSVKSGMNSAYQGVRKAVIRQIERDLQVKANLLANGEALSKTEARELVTSATRNGNEIVAAAIENSFWTFRLVSLLGTAYGIMVLFKSFLILFARQLFHPESKPKHLAQFYPVPLLRRKSLIGNKTDSFSLPKSTKSTWYFAKRDISIEGVPEDIAFPFRFRMFFARLWAGRMMFLRVEGNRTGRDDYSVKATVSDKKQMVRWDLHTGEAVCIRFKSLVAFTEEVRFRRVISLSVSSLVFGRILFHTAEGPGTIVLKTGDVVETSNKKKVVQNFDVESLVAWSLPMRFHVNTKLNVRNAYLSGCRLKVDGTARFVRDKDDRRTTLGGGILRLIPSFLLPI